MITTFIDEGVKHTAVTQQYQVGTYCIIDSNPSMQYSLNCTEKEYHKYLRKSYECIVEESSKLD
jgi:hypothetical protein